MDPPGLAPSWAQPFMHLPLDQWPLWARGLWRRTQSRRRLSGAARTSAELSSLGVSVPRVA